MGDLTKVGTEHLHSVAEVVASALAQAQNLSPERVMLVGAWCRDIWHVAQGHDFPTRTTHDLDLALALSGWETFEELTGAFPKVGPTGLRFAVAGRHVDLLPFGDEVEDPSGRVKPPTRQGDISVWAFEEVFDHSVELPLTEGISIRLPSIAGYAAVKLAAWLDRSEWRQVKDAGDIALVAYWYAESEDVERRLYESQEGQNILLSEEMDVTAAAARLLGKDMSTVIGEVRLHELLARWPGNIDLLTANFSLDHGPIWVPTRERRQHVIDAITRGLRGDP